MRRTTSLQARGALLALSAALLVACGSGSMAATATPVPLTAAVQPSPPPTADVQPYPAPVEPSPPTAAAEPYPAPAPPSTAVEPSPAPAPGTSAVPYPAPTAAGATPIYGYRVVQAFPHDRDAFTQGLAIDEGTLYEGTGMYGASELRRVDLATGEVQQRARLDPSYWGEGITVFGDRIIQLTWQSQVGLVYDRATFELLGSFSYPTEGWGLTDDGERLIMSDGTDTLRFLDPETFAEIGRVQVSDASGPVSRLNELEYIDGEVYANVWQSDRIARIDPATGRVTGWIDLSGLLTEEDRTQRVDVLNGIAHDAETGQLYVTGKWWPKLFEIELVPR